MMVYPYDIGNAVKPEHSTIFEKQILSANPELVIRKGLCRGKVAEQALPAVCGEVGFESFCGSCLHSFGIPEKKSKHSTEEATYEYRPQETHPGGQNEKRDDQTRKNSHHNGEWYQPGINLYSAVAVKGMIWLIRRGFRQCLRSSILVLI